MIGSGAQALDVNVSDPAIEALDSYVRLLERWNRRINLVSRCDHAELIERHVLDSLSILRLLDREPVQRRTTCWYDIGTGAGLPGLVIAIARPDLELRLVEPTGKKVAFLQHVKGELALANVEVIRGRVDDVSRLGSETVGAMSRATFPPMQWLAKGRGLAEPDGVVLVMTARPDRRLVDGAWLVDELRLPCSKAARTNILFDARPVENACPSDPGRLR